MLLLKTTVQYWITLEINAPNRTGIRGESGATLNVVMDSFTGTSAGNLMIDSASDANVDISAINGGPNSVGINNSGNMQVNIGSIIVSTDAIIVLDPGALHGVISTIVTNGGNAIESFSSGDIELLFNDISSTGMNFQGAGTTSLTGNSIRFNNALVGILIGSGELQPILNVQVQTFFMDTGTIGINMLSGTANLNVKDMALGTPTIAGIFMTGGFMTYTGGAFNLSTGSPAFSIQGSAALHTDLGFIFSGGEILNISTTGDVSVSSHQITGWPWCKCDHHYITQ